MHEREEARAEGVGERDQGAVPQRQRPRQAGEHLRHGARQARAAQSQCPEADGIPGLRQGTENLYHGQQRIPRKPQGPGLRDRPELGRAPRPIRCRSRTSQSIASGHRRWSTKRNSTPDPAPKKKPASIHRTGRRSASSVGAGNQVAGVTASDAPPFAAPLTAVAGDGAGISSLAATASLCTAGGSAGWSATCSAAGAGPAAAAGGASAA